MEGTSDLSGGLSNTSQFQNLKLLLFWGTKVAGNTEDLARLVQSQKLEFSGTQVTGNTEDLTRLAHLQKVRLSNTQVTGNTKASCCSCTLCVYILRRLCVRTV